MKHKRTLAAPRAVCALLCAALLLALGACASDSKPYKSYDLDKLVKLGDYIGVDVEFTTEDGYLDLYMEYEIFAQYYAAKGIDDDPEKEAIAEGDLVFFDYEGTAEGATAKDLEGMKGQALFIIGSGQFLPAYDEEYLSFEEQMIGQPRGKEFDVVVKFPDFYPDATGENNEALAGNEAVFKCMAHKIGVESEKITDEGVAGLTGGQHATLEEFREVLRPDLAAELPERLLSLNRNEAFMAAFDNAEFLELPAREGKYWDKQIVQEAEQYGYESADQYAQLNGYEDAQNLREEQVKRELFSFAVAAKVGIVATDEDIGVLLENVRAGSGDPSTDAQLIAKYGGKGRLLRMLTIDMVNEFIYENAKDSPAAIASAVVH